MFSSPTEWILTNKGSDVTFQSLVLAIYTTFCNIRNAACSPNSMLCVSHERTLNTDHFLKERRLIRPSNDCCVLYEVRTEFFMYILQTKVRLEMVKYSSCVFASRTHTLCHNREILCSIDHEKWIVYWWR